MRLLQTGMFGLLAIIALMLVLRPMVARLTLAASIPALAHSPNDGDALRDGSSSRAEHDSSIRRNDTAGVPAITGPTQGRLSGSGAVGLLEDESMVNLANVEGQLRASSIRRVADLVEKHPDESLSIVRAWMQQEAT